MSEITSFQMENDCDEFSDTYDHVSEDSLTAFERLKDSKVIITAQGEIKEEDINHHLSVTIVNLQKSIESITSRLKNLESRGSSQKTGLWPFESSTTTFAFLLTYPIITYLIMDRIKQRNVK
ncbi:uncharacterized protein LOC128397846 [Panonychus citri]|uniref:uncharacterized protein LOC128397846 n=1 Tax=Panonychus citri TaxID=50023 RepID=UPI0023082DAA|nr:uncharacterized protein LOC128397846 [Panonychus citri]